MNKSINIKMIMSVFMIILIIGIFCSPSSHAIGDMMSDGKAFLSKGNSIQSTINTTALKITSDYIYNTLLAIAIVVAVIVAMVLGIQFMLASADEKAKVKEALMPFTAGCIVVFGAFTIWKVAVKIGNNAESRIVGTGSIEEVRQENSELLSIIQNGQIESLTDEEVKRAYTSNYVDTDLHGWTTQDPRAGGKDKIYTLEEAIEKLSNDKRIIYDEAKKRGLLADDGIYLKK